MNAERWITLIALGGIAGALGQLARAIVGLKKLAEAAKASGQPYSEMLDPARLAMSVAIGFTAGAFAALLAKDVTDPNITFEQILAFAGAGYAGADFIEGAMRGLPPSAGGSAIAADGDGYAG